MTIHPFLSAMTKLRSDVEIRCDLAYEYADAMLRARES